VGHAFPSVFNRTTATAVGTDLWLSTFVEIAFSTSPQTQEIVVGVKKNGYVSPNDWLLRIIVVMITRIYPKDGLQAAKPSAGRPFGSSKAEDRPFYKIVKSQPFGLT
jgi:hypothetical protein